jgi:hypothetical protein
VLLVLPRHNGKRAHPLAGCLLRYAALGHQHIRETLQIEIVLMSALALLIEEDFPPPRNDASRPRPVCRASRMRGHQSHHAAKAMPKATAKTENTTTASPLFIGGASRSVPT